MSKDNPDKQKNIDDILSSIDSLLDTATDIEIDDKNDNASKPGSKTTATKKPVKKTAPSVKPSRSKPQSIKPAKPVQHKSTRTRKTSTSDQRLKTNEKADYGSTARSKAKSRANESITNAGTGTHEVEVQKDQPVTRKATATTPTPVKKARPAVDEKTGKKPDEAVKSEKKHSRDPDADMNIENKTSGSLNFTTVDDDLSQAMRELPILDDIVSVEDLALIGSGKEPPKKILTDAFKRLSLTDKLIEILENQLADYNISKLEYKYLHELFDQELEKEKNKK